MTRVRGFAPYSPRGNNRQILAWCQEILADYRQNGILPITLRQLSYRLVVLHDFDKSERAYSRLGDLVNRARRARMIDMP